MRRCKPNGGWCRASTSSRWWRATPRAPSARTRSWAWATPISVKAARRTSCSPSTSSASFCPSTRRTAAPTTRSTSSASRTPGRCGRRSAIRAKRATPSGSSGHSWRAIRTAPCCRTPRPGCARRSIGWGKPTTRSGCTTYRQRWYPGSIDRFSSLLKSDPEFSSRDSVYFYLAESYVKIKRDAQALPYYEKLVNEFQKSEHLQDAQKRITELKAQAANKS